MHRGKWYELHCGKVTRVGESLAVQDAGATETETEKSKPTVAARPLGTLFFAVIL